MVKRPCRYAEKSDSDECKWECTCYNKICCEYQDVDYNYIDFVNGHEEINIVRCKKEGGVYGTNK